MSRRATPSSNSLQPLPWHSHAVLQPAAVIFVTRDSNYAEHGNKRICTQIAHPQILTGQEFAQISGRSFLRKSHYLMTDDTTSMEGSGTGRAEVSDAESIPRRG
jgi:hypothetical protein